MAIKPTSFINEEWKEDQVSKNWPLWRTLWPLVCCSQWAALSFLPLSCWAMARALRWAASRAPRPGPTPACCRRQNSESATERTAQMDNCLRR